MLCAITRVPIPNAKCSVCVCVCMAATASPSPTSPSSHVTAHLPSCPPPTCVRLSFSFSFFSLSCSVLFCLFVFAVFDWKRGKNQGKQNCHSSFLFSLSFSVSLDDAHFSLLPFFLLPLFCFFSSSFSPLLLLLLTLFFSSSLDLPLGRLPHHAAYTPHVTRALMG